MPPQPASRGSVRETADTHTIGLSERAAEKARNRPDREAATVIMKRIPSGGGGQYAPVPHSATSSKPLTEPRGMGTSSRGARLAENSSRASSGSTRARAGSMGSATSSTRSRKRKPTMTEIIDSPMDSRSRHSSDSPQHGNIPSEDQHAFHSMQTLISGLVPSSDRLAVAEKYDNNDPKNATGSVQAFAMIAAPSWTFFVKETRVMIGRSSDNETTHEASGEIDIDLNPSKTVSRKHALIVYNSVSRQWEMELLGRNGVRLDGTLYKPPDKPVLRSGTVVEVGGEQFVFCLPDPMMGMAPLVSTAPAPEPVSRKKSRRRARADSAAGQSSVASNSSGFASPTGNPQMTPSSSMSSSFSGITGTGTAGSPILIRGIDYSPDAMSDYKPPISYSAMIAMAIRGKADGRSTLSDIYDFISKNFSHFRNMDKAGWQNSVRHNLSLSAAFTKVPRELNEPGKGMKWIITPGFEEKVDVAKVRIAHCFQSTLDELRAIGGTPGQVSSGPSGEGPRDTLMQAYEPSAQSYILDGSVNGNNGDRQPEHDTIPGVEESGSNGDVPIEALYEAASSAKTLSRLGKTTEDVSQSKAGS